MAMIRGGEPKKFSRAVWVTIAAVSVLLIVGLFNLSNAAGYTGGDFHRTQMIWVVLSVLVAAAVTFTDMRFFQQLSPAIYWLTILLLVLVLIFGRDIKNAKRWLELGPIALQPSEFVKPALVLFLARFFHAERNPERYTLRALLRPMLYVAIPTALVMLQPDLGTSLVIIAVGFSMMFFEGIRMRSILILLGIVLLLIPLAWQLDIVQPYQKERVRTWLAMSGAKDIKKDSDRSMQPEQALWAVGSGRVLGKGGMQGVQSRLRYLPEMHNDYILASYAEERGFVGSVFLMGLYLVLVLAMLRIAVSARERFGVLVSVGAVAIIFWQVVFNVGMVIGIFPVVGLTLPFMSYGGSSQVSSMIAVGLALNAGVHRGSV
ncbi:rod shape-determining protein RodA [Myxococcota bacterium]|nr:rod shape-determining protein RodA [Myxococcota bacterium]